MKLKILGITTMALAMTLSAGALVAQAEGNIKANIENRFEKKDLRNTIVEQKKELRDTRDSITERAKEMREDMKASTTAMFKEIRGEKRDLAKKMQLRAFEIRKNALVRELNQTLRNLTNIRNRIVERISKAEATGRDMTDAKAKLTVADAKLLTAKTAVDAFASYSYASSTTATSTASSTIEINLEKPRKIGDDAIKAVKAARDAFKDVVVAIAHAMGLGSGSNNNTATTTTATSTNSTSTTTNSTSTSTDSTATSTATSTSN